MQIDDIGKQIKSDDDFFKMSEEQWKPKEIERQGGIVEKIKNFLPFLLPVTFVFIIIIGAATFYMGMQISTLNQNLIYLNKIVTTIDTASLKSEIAEMGTKIEVINKENDKLRSELTHLRSEIEVIKARKEKIDTPAAKKKVVGKNPGKNPRTR
jgi:regulator of replication initiation timing